MENRKFKTDGNFTQRTIKLIMLNGATTYEVTVVGLTRVGEGESSVDRVELATDPRGNFFLS